MDELMNPTLVFDIETIPDIAGLRALHELDAGVSDAEADKIIAGRPYLSKANLVTGNILPRKTYDGLRALVIAKQNKASAAKLEKLKKERASR